MFTRAIRPSANAARRVVVPAPRYTSQLTNDPEVLEREKQKNLRGEQHSTHTNAPGWNELLASDSEANIKAANAFAEAAATSHEEVQGTLSDKGVKAEQARRAAMYTPSEEAVRADRRLHR
ncbi:hypothetical protein FRC11_012694 [Ceratobasidium sp. 423]|nr:hypothetical protein FRC11_012694 [Ceratobasidium sp. 423]